jgi:diacylglycerol kinase (ATP)
MSSLPAEKYTAPEEGKGEESKTAPGHPAALAVSAAPTIYINVPSLTAADKRRLNVPVCCAGGCHYCSIVCLCCLITVAIPAVLVFAMAPSAVTSGDVSGAYTAQALIAVGATLCGVGVLWCCTMSSFPTLLKEGVLCMPKSVPPVSAWAQGPAGGMTTVKKLKVIVNPNAGVKKGASNLAICKKVWEAKGIEVIVVHTTHAGHAREIGRDEDLTGIDALVAIGGDGTLHETINGFLSRDTPSDVALGFIPGGSGNSIMAHFGTWDIKEAAERISNGETNRMDINTVTTCGETVVSVNLIAFGLVGTSGVLAEDYRCLGPARYNIVALWKILTGISEATKCELQDETGKTLMIEDNLTTLYLNKTQHFGKGLRAAPFAKMGNGLMELYGLRSGTVTRGGQIAVLQQLPAGAHQSNPAILYKQCSKCVVTLPGAGVFNVDGEVLRHDGTVTVACHKERLKVFAPRDAFPHLL